MAGQSSVEADDLGFDVRLEHKRIDGAIPNGTGLEAKKLPTPISAAHEGLKQAVRAQILAFCAGDLDSKSLDQLQRFCSAAGMAMVPMENPEQLVRNRFGQSNMGVMQFPSIGEYAMGGSLTPSPANETYGANASRGIIESAMKVAKDLMVTQEEGRAKDRAPTMPELLTALTIAKGTKAPKLVVQSLQHQILTLAKASLPPEDGAKPVTHREVRRATRGKKKVAR